MRANSETKVATTTASILKKVTINVQTDHFHSPAQMHDGSLELDCSVENLAADSNNEYVSDYE